jgi:hypothetical protein
MNKKYDRDEIKRFLNDKNSYCLLHTCHKCVLVKICKSADINASAENVDAFCDELEKEIAL